MDTLDFYKELYFKQIERKTELDNATNIPIFVTSAIISIHFFIYSQEIQPYCKIACYIVSGISFFCGLYIIFYLIKSFTNFFKCYNYKEIAGMKEYYQYEVKLLKVKDIEKAKKEFDEHLKNEFSDCAEHNFFLNIKRTEDIAQAKKGMFVLIIFTLALFLVYLLSNLLIMSDDKAKTDQKPQVDTTTSEVKVEGPKSVYIQNRKESDSSKKDTKS